METTPVTCPECGCHYEATKPSPQPIQIPSAILECIGMLTCVMRSDFLSRDAPRHAPVVRARVLLIGALRDAYQIPYADIATIMGYRDHTSPLHHYKSHVYYLTGKRGRPTDMVYARSWEILKAVCDECIRGV